MKNQLCLQQESGWPIPQLGMGTYMIDDYQQCKEAVLTALKCGYRHIDTAQIYKNEAAVGDALAESGIPREDIFITTKLWVSNFSCDKAQTAISGSLKKLKTDYIDLMLIHRPYGNYMPGWRAMEEAVDAGKIRSIGISNFDGKQTAALLREARIKPVVNQIECHPYYQQNGLRQYLRENGILVGAWYPLGHGDRKLLQDPVLIALAEKYGKSPAQIILRWHIQTGNIVLPKSTKENHLRDNRKIFDFSLTEEEMARIMKLDKNTSYFTTPLWLDALMAKLFLRI